MILLDTKSFDMVSRALAEIPQKAKKGVSMAINSAVRKGRTTIGKQITSQYVIKRSQVYERLSQQFASPSRLYGALEARGPGIPLKEFKVQPKSPQPRRKPVLMVEIVKGQRKAFRGAFIIAKLGMHVFTRKQSSRFPIEKRKSTSVPQMMVGLRAGEAIRAEITEQFNKEASRQIERILK